MGCGVSTLPVPPQTSTDVTENGSVKEFLANVRESQPILDHNVRPQPKNSIVSYKEFKEMLSKRKFSIRKQSDESRRDTLGREVVVPPVLSSSPDAVQDYVASLESARQIVNQQGALGDADNLLKIRDNPTRKRRLSSRTPKFMPIQEAGGEPVVVSSTNNLSVESF